MFTGGITTGEQGAAGSACTSGDRDAASGAGPEVEPRWQVVLRLLEDNARTRVKLEAIESELILEADACDLHRHLGYVSLAEFLERHLHYSRHAANERIRVARELPSLPRMRAAYQAGELSFAHVRELTRVVTPATEQAYLDAAGGKTSRQVQQLCSGKKAGDAPDAPPDPALVRHLVMLELDGETFALWRRAHQALEVECGEALEHREVIALLCRRAFELDAGSGQSRGDCNDADAEADAHSGTATGTGPATGPEAATVTGTAAATVTAAVTGTAAATVTSSATGTASATGPATGTEAVTRRCSREAERAEASTRTRRIPSPATLHAVVRCPDCQRATIAAVGTAEPLTSAQRDRALCDAVDIGDLASDALTRPISGIPAALRRKVMVRDRFACVVPGCRSRHNLEVHHILPRTDGGAHSMSNLSVWCHAHHQRLHDGLIRVAGTAPALEFEWRHAAALDADEPFTWQRHRPVPDRAVPRDRHRGAV